MPLLLLGQQDSLSTHYAAQGRGQSRLDSASPRLIILLMPFAESDSVQTCSEMSSWSFTIVFGLVFLKLKLIFLHFLIYSACFFSMNQITGELL